MSERLTKFIETVALLAVLAVVVFVGHHCSKASQAFENNRAQSKAGAPDG